MTPEEIAVSIVASEPFLWLMVGSNHTESQLAALRPAWKAYREAGGRTWGRKANAVRSVLDGACERCGNEIANHQKKIKLTINGKVTYRHERCPK